MAMLPAWKVGTIQLVQNGIQAALNSRQLSGMVGDNQSTAAGRRSHTNFQWLSRFVIAFDTGVESGGSAWHGQGQLSSERELSSAEGNGSRFTSSFVREKG